METALLAAKHSPKIPGTVDTERRIENHTKYMYIFQYSALKTYWYHYDPLCTSLLDCWYKIGFFFFGFLFRPQFEQIWDLCMYLTLNEEVEAYCDVTKN